MNFDGVSCWVWVFSQAKRLLLEIVLDLLNTTGMWIKHLVVNGAIIKFFFCVFLGWIKLCFIALLSDRRLSWFHVYNLSELLPLWIVVIYVIESYTIRLTNYSCVLSLMFMWIDLNVFVRFERIFTFYWALFIMIVYRKNVSIELYLTVFEFICKNNPVWNRL